MFTTYLIRCHEPECPNEAAFKIAAQWSDGLTGELKTYALTCESCLGKWYRASLAKQAACRRAPNEVLESPGIYRLRRGQRDVQLERLNELEAHLVHSTPAK